MTEIDDDVLNELRKEIDVLDNQVLELLEQRFELIKRVSQRKKEKGLPIRDLERENEVIKSKCDKTDLPEDFIRGLYRSMIDTAIKMQEKEHKK